MAIPAPAGGGTTTVPASISTPDVWSLHSRPDLVDAAASRWRATATALGAAVDDLNNTVKSVQREGWEGDAADSFETHRKNLIADLDDAQARARAVGDALASAAGALRTTQEHLIGEWAKVAAVPCGYASPRRLVFQPRTETQRRIVLDSLAQCRQIRKDLDGMLSDDVVRFEKARTAFRQIAATWTSVSLGNRDPFATPSEVATAGVIRDGNRVIVNTGTGDDEVRIGIDPVTGLQVVTVNGVAYDFPAGADIVVRGGDGNDTITVAPGTNVRVTLIGGADDDVLSGGGGDDQLLGLDGYDQVYSGGGDDRVSAGADRDYVDGGGGADVLSGGLGDDTIYGLAGDDALVGGEGQDYLEGAVGADTIDGGAGNDIISGGVGDDTLRGGSDDDVTYGGSGSDHSDGGRGTDRVFGEQADAATATEQQVTVELRDLETFINVEGSPEFQDRVEADLELLGSSPRGQEMLAALQQGHDEGDSGMLWWHRDGDSLTIREYNNPEDPDNSTASHGNGNNVINYNPHLDYLTMDSGDIVDGPPSVVLYHEMAHVYDYMNDTLVSGEYTGTDNPGVANKEREAVGLPIDGDSNPATPNRLFSGHPYALTENGLREEMGAPYREAY